MINFIVAYGLMGSIRASRIICTLSKILGIDTLLLLGDTVSPSIIKWLTETCGIKVYGVLGRYDNPALSRLLRSYNSLIECKLVDIDGLSVYGYGYTRCEPRSHNYNGIDILATSICGVRYTCCSKQSDLVDEIASTIRARIVLTGGCIEPCHRDSIYSPGSAIHGFIGLVRKIDGNIKFNFIHTDKLVNDIIDKYS